MAWRGGSLTDLFNERNLGPPTRRALRGIARDAGERMTVAAAMHTPKRSGRLAERWETLPVRRVGLEDGAVGYQSGTSNPSPLAHLIERGVEAHSLSPRTARDLGLLSDEDAARALDTPQGPRARAEHPGFAGSYMLLKAAAEVDAELPELAQPHLSEWARAIENGAKTVRL